MAEVSKQEIMKWICGMRHKLYRMQGEAYDAMCKAEEEGQDAVAEELAGLRREYSDLLHDLRTIQEMVNSYECPRCQDDRHTINQALQLVCKYGRR